MQIAGIQLPTKTTILVGVAIILALCAAGTALYFYTKYKSTLSTIANPTELARAESHQLLEAVGKIIELPTGEEPTIATVTDKEKLSSQTFFANSQNGDKVIIYTGAKKAILYRPSTQKIIDVAPINLGTESATLQTTPSPATTSAKVALLNGTTTVGLTRTYETTELKTKTPAVQVVVRDNAKRQDYAKTILVDISENKSSEAAVLATSLGISLEQLPSGENASASAFGAADFLIIVGVDKK